MKDFSELKQRIVDNIKANGRGAITGNLLQEQLLTMADSMELQSFEGFATPSVTPVHDNTAEHVYFAMESGDYSAFVEGLELEEGDFYMFYIMPNNEEWTAVNLREFLKGEKGDPGYTPRKGVDYFDGKDGQPGKDGADGRDGGLNIPYFFIQEGEDGRLHLFCKVPVVSDINVYTKLVDGRKHLILEF